ncbi:voltage-gated potassium channel [Marasmius fiardii PR-910]|nr:voltage-gated potassium channel [Marasmius fiardii PR-910]
MTTSTSGIELTRLQHNSSSQFLTEDPPQPSSSNFGQIVFGAESSRKYEEEQLASIQPLWKRDLFALLEQPKSSSGAMFIHIFMTSLILTSALVTVLETVPAFHTISPQFWFGIETTLVAMFTVEYIARCVAWSASWRSLLKWMTSFFGIIDLLSVLPYYIEILMHQDTAVFFRFSILRMFRLIRVFRPFRYNNTILLTIEVMYLSVRRSQHALFAIAFFVIMILTIFSTLLYFAERGTWDTTLETFINSDGDPTQFASIPAAAWFVIVTITTVGYGEITPRSFLGRLVTLPLLVFGLLLIALPSFVLGREFSLVWEKMSSKNSVHEDDYHDLDSFIHHRHSPLLNRERDLSNLKLAKNQTELSKQISELRDTVELQGEMIKRLLEALEKGKQRAE